MAKVYEQKFANNRWTYKGRLCDVMPGDTMVIPGHFGIVVSYGMPIIITVEANHGSPKAQMFTRKMTDEHDISFERMTPDRLGGSKGAGVFVVAKSEGNGNLPLSHDGSRLPAGDLPVLYPTGPCGECASSTGRGSPNRTEGIPIKIASTILTQRR
jgi:hypothetical protein